MTAFVLIVVIIIAAYCWEYYKKIIRILNTPEPTPSINIPEQEHPKIYSHREDGCICLDYYTDIYMDAVPILKCYTFADENILLETKRN